MVSSHIKTLLGCLFASEIVSYVLGFIIWFSFFYSLPERYDSPEAYLYMRETTLVAVGVLVSLFIVSFLRFHHELGIYREYYRVFVRGYFRRSFLVSLVVIAVWSMLSLIFFTSIRVWVLLQIFAVSQFIDFGLKRFLSQFVRRMYLRRSNTRNILVIGMNRHSYEFQKFIGQNRQLGFKVLGFIDDLSQGKPDFLPEVNYLGGFDKIEELFRRRIIDSAALFLPLRSHYDQSLDIIRLAAKYGVSVDFMSLPFDPGRGKFRATHVGDRSNFLYYTAPTESLPLFIKRVMDIAGAMAFFLVFWPLFAGIALFIRITDGSPVFFEQRRVGYNKRVFPMLKFRTMVRDAEKRLDEVADLNEMDGAGFKIANDPRFIRGGAFLRRYSLDELPQFLNVLTGSMSLVGPRPLSIRDYNLLPEDWQLRRFSMKPGLTCIWQVSGRNALLFEDWMKMDLEYIDNWTLALDVRLLLKTFTEVFKGGGK